MSRIRYCHGGSVGDGLCLSGDVTTNEVATCDMGSCCDYDWSGWTGCCRNTDSKNVRLRFRGGCEGSTAPQEVSKPCDVSGMATDTCLVVIQNSLELGIIGSGYNMTYVINPDEFVNFHNQVLQGQRLGHADRFATAHTLSVPGQQVSTGSSWSNNAAWETTGWSGVSSGITTGSGFQMMFDGEWIMSDQLSTMIDANGNSISGLMINNRFVEGEGETLIFYHN